MSSYSKFCRANRRNSKLSTGPKTQAGKAASSQNALTHGLTSTKLILPSEDPRKLEKMRRTWYRHFKPSSRSEKALVSQYIIAQWLHERALRAETALFNELSAGSDNPYEPIAVAFLEGKARLRNLLRYVTKYQRASLKAIVDLRPLVRRRLLQQFGFDNYHDSNGFVSQSPWSAAADSSSTPPTPRLRTAAS